MSPDIKYIIIRPYKDINRDQRMKKTKSSNVLDTKAGYGLSNPDWNTSERRNAENGGFGF